MRIAALFLGLMAGLSALLAPSAFRTDLLSSFLDMWSATSSGRLLGLIVWYAIPCAALLGGLIATVTPGFAALLLLGAAVGWLGIGLSMPQHFDYQLVAPAAAATLGGLLAFLAGELQVRRRRMVRRSRKLAAELPTDVEVEREAALLADPLLMPRNEPAPPLRRPVPLTLDEVSVTSRPSSAPPLFLDIDVPRPQRDASDWPEAKRSATPPHSEPQTPPEAPATEAEPPPAPQRPDADLWPEAQLRQPIPEARELRPRRRSGLIAALAAVGAVCMLGLLLAGGYLLYRDGVLTNVFARPAEAPVLEAASGKAPAAATAALPKEPAVQTKPTPPKEVALATPPAAVPAAAPPAAAAPAIVTAKAQPETYTDPFSYCRAVATIDHVDSRYTGSAFTEAMARALLIPTGSARDRVRWRCFEGAVLACTSYAGPVCDMAPTVIEMQEFCERNPNVAQLMAPSGTWSCADGRPQLPPDASWPVDERGFLPNSWVVVPDTGRTPTG